MPNYVALLRASFEADDEASAQVISEIIRANATADLYPEEGDEVSVMDVVEFNASLTNELIVLQMRSLRNSLIAMRRTQCVDLARELDHLAWLIEHKADPDFEPGGYDYGNFIDIIQRVLDGGNPEI